MSINMVGVLVIGFASLILGAELLVRGASRLAAALGVSPVIVGLTVVSLSTSAPEIFITTRAALSGASGLAIGNVVGSNISNILLILGISAIVAPVVVHQRLIRMDVPLMIMISLAMFIMAIGGVITRFEGILLVISAAAYISFAIRQSRQETQEIQAEYAHEFGPGPSRQLAWQALFVIAGVGLLILGANWFVGGAESLARSLGVSELVIGLTVVSLGTSTPELITSLVASLRGERDIAAGNLIGSNIFNILVVLGLAAAVAPQGVPVAASAIRFDIPVMMAAAVACLPIFFIGNQISRWEGFLFVGYYAAYLLYLLLDSARHNALPLFSAVMLWFVIPLTVVTLLIFGFRELQEIRRRRIEISS